MNVIRILLLFIIGLIITNLINDICLNSNLIEGSVFDVVDCPKGSGVKSGLTHYMCDECLVGQYNNSTDRTGKTAPCKNEQHWA